MNYEKTAAILAAMQDGETVWLLGCKPVSALTNRQCALCKQFSADVGDQAYFPDFARANDLHVVNMNGTDIGAYAFQLTGDLPCLARFQNVKGVLRRKTATQTVKYGVDQHYTLAGLRAQMGLA